MKTIVTTFERPAPGTNAFDRGERPKRLSPQPLSHVPHPHGSDEAQDACKAALSAQGFVVCGVSSTNGTGAAADGEPIPKGLVVYVHRVEKKPGRRAR